MTQLYAVLMSSLSSQWLTHHLRMLKRALNPGAPCASSLCLSAVSQSRAVYLSPSPYVVILISCSGLVSFVLLLLTCLCCKRGGEGFNVSLQHVRDSLTSYSVCMFTLEYCTQKTINEVELVRIYETRMSSEPPLTCTWSHLSGWWCRYSVFWDFFFNLLLWLNQEFDNADGEDCSGGSSPIQEDSLSSCPSLPEVYTLPVRDRPDCPDLKNGAGTKQISSVQRDSTGVELGWEEMVHLCWKQHSLFWFCLLVNVQI